MFFIILIFNFTKNWCKIKDAVNENTSTQIEINLRWMAKQN